MTNSPTDDLLAEAPWLRRFAAGLVRSAADADDLVQDTLSEALAHSRAHGASGGEAPSAGAPIGASTGASGRGLLAGIARNLSRASRRRDGRRSEREVRHGQDRGSPVAPAADEDARRLDLLRVLLDELATLPPAQRRAITSRFLDELEPTEIAARDGVSPSSVRSQLARGLAALRERMDRRGAGREQWLGALGPWAMGNSLLPAGLLANLSPNISPSISSGAATGTTSSAALPGAATSTSPLLAGAAGTTLMKTTFWLALLVAIPTLITGLWWLQENPAPKSPTAAAMAAQESASSPDLAQVSQPATRGNAAATPARPDGASDEDASPSTALANPGAPGSIQLVDIFTGEPVPDITLEMLDHPTWTSSSEQVRSDAEGRIEFDPARYESITLMRLIERDSTVYGQKSTRRQSEASFPFTGPIPVHVGPTFTFELPDGLAENAWSMQVRFRALDDTTPHNDPSATIRGGHPNWVRFPREVTELQGDAFELVFETRQDFMAARVPVTRTRGIEPEILRPVFEPRGAARFTLEVDGAAQLPSVEVDVRPEGHVLPLGLELRTTLTSRGEVESKTATIQMLPPGAYTWTIPGAGTDRNDAFTVLAGETTDVDIAPEALGATFDSEILIDATAAPGASVADWVAMVTSDEDPDAGFMTRAVPVEGAAGQFRIALKGLHHGTWHVAVHPKGGAALEPSVVPITPGALPEIMRVTPGAERASLTLRVLDDATGRPVQLATAAVLIVPKDVFEFTPTDPIHSTLTTDKIPRLGPIEIFVRAPGYRGEVLLHDPDQDPDQREIHLTPGWRSRVLVINVATMAPEPGINVRVDGQDAGITDAAGVCWIEGERPPLLIEIDPGDGPLKIVGTPNENVRGGESKTDPTFGFVFQVKP